MKKLLISFILLGVALGAYCQETEVGHKNIKFLMEAGVEYGGDELLDIFFTNGESQTIKAGQGGYLAVGGEFHFNKVENLFFRTTVGIKYTFTAADDANIGFSRIPITALAYWSIKDDFRVGAGVTSHQNVKLNGDGFFPDESFSSSIGPRVELGYKWIGLSYTAISYAAENEMNFSANSIGLSLSFTLPK